MFSVRRCALALCLVLAAGASLRADEPTPQQLQDLLLQQDRQRQIQSETDHVVRRMGTMLRVLDFYQLDKAAEKRMLEEMVGVLGGLSKSQMTDVIQRLDAAAKAKTAEETYKEATTAYTRHREILDSLKVMLARYDAIRNLDQAADRLDKQAVQQLELHFFTEQLVRDLEAMQNPNLSPTGRLLISKRNRRGFESSRYGDDQNDLQAEVYTVFKQVKELRVTLNDEQKQRVALMEKLAAEYRVHENMRTAAQKLQATGYPQLRHEQYKAAIALQWESAGRLKELARVLRFPGDMLAILKEARDRVDQAIVKQTELADETKTETPAEAKKDEPKKDAPKEAKGLTLPGTNPLPAPPALPNPFLERKTALEKSVKDAQAAEKLSEIGKKQARLEHETKDTASLVKPVAKDAAQKLEAAEKAMQTAKDALAKLDPKWAAPPQEKATDELKQARAEIDKLIDHLEKQKNDPLAALKTAAEKLDNIIKEQTETRDKTKETVTPDQQNLKTPQLAQKQKELALQTNELKETPLPGKEKVEPALAKAEKAMKEAAASLTKKESPQAVPKQDMALKNLEEARKELAEKIAEMEKRRDDLAKLEEAAKKLDELTKQEAKVAEQAKDLTKKSEPAMAKDLAGEQAKLTPKASDLAKELEKAAPEAAQKVSESTKNMQAAKNELEKNQPKPGAAEAKEATNKLQDAQKALAKAMDDLKAKEIADQAALQPKMNDPNAAAQQIAKALEQTEKAEMQAQAAQKGQQGPDLAKLQAEIASKAEQMKLEQAAKDAGKAATELKQGELNKAIGEQEKALAQLQEAAANPQTAKPMAETTPSDAKPMPGDAKPAQAKAGEPMASEPKANQAQPAQPKTDAAKGAPMPKAGQPKPGEAKPALAKAGAKPSLAKATQPTPKGEPMPKTAQAKAGEKMSGEAKDALAKTGDAKQGEPMAGQAKAADMAQGQKAGAPAQAKGGPGEPMPPSAAAAAKTPAQLAEAQKDLMELTKALAKSQESTQAAMAALAQAQAQAPKTVQPQLQEAGKQLAQANQQLQKASPKQAGQAQKQAAQQLGKALDTLNAALAKMNQQPGQPGQPGKGSPMTAQAGKDGEPMPGEGEGEGMGEGKDGKGQGKGQGKPMPNQQGKGQEKNDGKGLGDRTPDGKVANARSLSNGADGDGSFLHLPPRQRELIRQAMTGALPPEYAAVIQQYYINIARGRQVPAAPATPR